MKLTPERERELSAWMEAWANLIEPGLPDGFTFALFLFEKRKDPQSGNVLLHISRDRSLSLAAVSRWVWDLLDARETKAKG
jgi:hypothetical protein